MTKIERKFGVENQSKKYRKRLKRKQDDEDIHTKR